MAHLFRWKRLGIIALVIISLIIISTVMKKPASDTAAEINAPAKAVDIIPYGDFTENKFREILGTVVSPADNTIAARVAGTIDVIYPGIGYSVKAGEILARYLRVNDITQISHENALSSLNTTKVSAENSVTNAELSLSNARTELKQTITSQERSYSQTLEALRTSVLTATSDVESAKDYADRLFQVSNQFRNQASNDELKVGRNNILKKQIIYNATQQIIQDYNTSQNESAFQQDVLTEAAKIRGFLVAMQTTLNDLSNLVRQTNISSNFDSTARATIQTTADAMLSTINTDLTSIDSSIETAKSQVETKELTILAKENAVKSLESALNVAEASADGQISAARNAVKLTQKSQNDLVVRAPISGTITEVYVYEKDDVAPGTTLFTMVSNSANPEILAYLTEREFRQLQNLGDQPVEVVFENGNIISVTTSLASSKLSGASQKMEVRFYPTKAELAENDITIGSFAKIRLPITNAASIFMPISALSFEPDGAEVFIVNESKTIERRKVITGRISGDSVEIQNGLAEGDLVIKYRNRVNTGETVTLKNLPLAPTPPKDFPTEETESTDDL